MKFQRPIQNVVLENLSSAPSSPSNGQLYYDTTSNTIRGRNNGAWATFAALEPAQTFQKTNTFAPDINSTGIIITVAGNTGQVANIFEAHSAPDVGQGGASQLTTYLNEKGELRVICAKSTSVGVRFKSQPSQTANMMEHTDTTNAVLAWMAGDGSWRAPNFDFGPKWSINGALSTGVGTKRWYNDTGQTLTIRAVRTSVDTVPTGASIIVDINKNGSTIFTTQGNRPTIAISGHTSGKVINMDVTTLADGDFLTFDVDQVGSTIAGSNLTVQVLVY